MTEREFISRRRADWERLARLTETARSRGLAGLARDDLSAVGLLYRKSTSDLAYARAHFPGGDVEGYLNMLVAQGHALVHGGAKLSGRAVTRFVRWQLPVAVREHIRPILLAAAVFFLAAGVGAWAYATHNAVIIGLIPEAYRRMIDSVADGESRGALDVAKPILSSAIMTNNIQVSFIAFALGLTFGLGTLWVVWQNGLLLGALAWVTHSLGQDLRFWSLILPHGVIELPAIFLAAGAGLMIGSALLRPGDLRRVDALRIAGQKAMPLLGGVVGLLIAAGLIEGFFTPAPVAPSLKLLFATVLFLAFITYIALPGTTGVRGISVRDKR